MPDGPRPPRLGGLCRTIVRRTAVTGCGVSLSSTQGQGITAHATATWARTLEDLQHTLGVGPGEDAARSGAPVLVPDLRDRADGRLHRWPGFSRGALDLGVHATFCLPLTLGTSRVGALNLYRFAPGPLSTEEVAHGRDGAEAVAVTLAEDVDDEGSWLRAGPGSREPPTGGAPMLVHQAAGMVTVQLGVPIDQALLRMRATAFAEGITVDQLAEDIVGRRRRMSKEEA